MPPPEPSKTKVGELPRGIVVPFAMVKVVVAPIVVVRLKTTGVTKIYPLASTEVLPV